MESTATGTRVAATRTILYPTADLLPSGDLALTELPSLKKGEARILGIAGYRTIGQIARADPAALAARTKIAPERIRQLQGLGELIDVPGLGPEAALLLVECGVRGIRDLAETEAQDLVSRVVVDSPRRKGKLAGGPVNPRRAEEWIRAARTYGTYSAI